MRHFKILNLAPKRVSYESLWFTDSKTVFGLGMSQKLFDLSHFKHLKFRIFSKFLSKKFFSRDIGMPAQFEYLQMKAYIKLHKIYILNQAKWVKRTWWKIQLKSEILEISTYQRKNIFFLLTKRCQPSLDTIRRFSYLF